MTQKKSWFRMVLSAVVLTIALLLVGAGGSALVACGWQARQLDQRFAHEGLVVPAELAGYQYVKLYGRGAHSGGRPVLRYVAYDHVARLHVAQEYGAVGEYGRRTLPMRKIEITYLPEDPNMARVRDWYSSSAYVNIVIGGFICAFALFCLIGAWKIILRERPRP